MAGWYPGSPGERVAATGGESTRVSLRRGSDAIRGAGVIIR